MIYEIIASGSKGNCVIINDVMIDCGISFKKINEYLYNIRVLLLTHIHSDHIKESTLRQIKKLFPKIKIIGNYEVHQMFGVDIVCNNNFLVKYLNYEFMPFLCEHDVLTYGYTWEYQGLNVIYATDTSSMKHAPNKKYDYIFIESNHDEKKLEIARQATTIKGYDPYLSGKRHLSTQQAKGFYYSHRRSKESLFIELHKSERFY